MKSIRKHFSELLSEKSVILSLQRIFLILVTLFLVLESVNLIMRKKRIFYEEQMNRLYYSLAAFASMKKCLARKLGPTQEIRILRECFE
jgi:hypothetical protein